ncbi:MAG: hypothetical protein IJC88_04880 [Oscillospiraceae bacterium]|nr:hypothetical protein [Oscillospiraceae bacterium]
MKRTVAFLCAVVMLVTMFAGCTTKKGEIETLFTNYQAACNALDLNAMMACVTPTVTNPLKTAAGIVGKLTANDTDAMFDKIGALIMNETKVSRKEYFQTLSFKVGTITIEEDVATVEVIRTYTGNGAEYTEEDTYECVFYADQWYLKHF